MSPTTIRVLPAFAWHLGHLLSFRHDGLGLPRAGSPVLVLLVGVKLAMASLILMQLMPEADLVTGLLKSLLVVLALYVSAVASRQFYAFSGYLLLWTGVDVGVLLLHATVEHVPAAFVTTCYAWGFSAYMVLLIRAVSRQNHEEKNTS